jgi:SAM-dependent methyltransferase
MGLAARRDHRAQSKRGGGQTPCRAAPANESRVAGLAEDGRRLALCPVDYSPFAGDVERFERFVAHQQAVSPEHYDDDYFAAEWRAEGNRYDVETRRRIEDRNPALIKDVFAPKRVLDVGCGPGFLMLFLQELAIEVDGIDFSPSSLTLAPEAVRERIRIGPVDTAHVPEHSYDLVVCREVLEHLTVVQIGRTVEQICRASSRFAYVTTRFVDGPESILEATTDFETDPTHVSVLTKDFLRVLFVLQGFRRRDDLERRMDWAQKDRVLVYERP